MVMAKKSHMLDPKKILEGVHYGRPRGIIGLA